MVVQPAATATQATKAKRQPVVIRFETLMVRSILWLSPRPHRMSVTVVVMPELDLHRLRRGRHPAKRLRAERRVVQVWRREVATGATGRHRLLIHRVGVGCGAQDTDGQAIRWWH
jgi:hypothetical protein